MEKLNGYIRKILLTAGLIEIAVGLLHFIMPKATYQSKGYSGLNSFELDFVTLVILAVGILLITFGSLTIYFSQRLEAVSEIILFYVTLKSLLWIGRVALELMYPIKLNMFTIEPFTAIVLPGLVFEMLLFILSAVLIRKSQLLGPPKRKSVKY